MEDDLKTPNSRRTIDLDDRTVAVLRSHRRRQAEEALAAGYRRERGFVFASSTARRSIPT